MELLTIKELGQTSRINCMTCGKQITTAPAERKALKAGQGIEPRQCRQCKPRARKPEPRKPGHPYRWYECTRCGETRKRDTATVRKLDPNGPPPPPQQCKYCNEETRVPLHGTSNEYFSHGCRCAPCTEAVRVYNAGRGYVRAKPFTGPCAYEGCTNEYSSHDPKVRFCSLSCGTKNVMRERGYVEGGTDESYWIPEATRQRVYSRDSYVCHICHEVCSPEYSSDDPMSPTLDHIVPRSKWPKDDTEYLHDEMNLKTCHLTCNSARHADWNDAAWVSLLVIEGSLPVEDARRLRVESARL